MIKTPPSWLLHVASGLAVGLSLFVPAAASAAMINDFVATIPLTSRLDIVLPVEADMALVLPDGRIVLAAKRRAGVDFGGSLTLYDPRTRQAGQTIDVPHDISLVEHSSATGQTFVAGNQADAFHITRIGGTGGNLAAWIQAGAIEHPSLAISDDGTVFVGNRANTSVSIVSPDRFLVPEKAKAEFAANGGGYAISLRYTGPGNVSGLAVSGDGRTLFVSDSNEARLSALDVQGKQVVVDQLGYGDAKDAESLPLVIRAQSSASATRSKDISTSLIAADARRSRLLLADYNASFQALDAVSEVGFGLTAPLLRQDRSGSPLLVDTNADQTVIVLASRTGRGLRVYGRNGAAIEVGPDFADLPEAPLSLDVSQDGRLAALMLSDRKTLSLLREDSAVAIEPQTEAIRALQRQLTELGYPIGLVDGIAGTKTKIAVQRALQIPGSAKGDIQEIGTMSESEILDLTNRLKLSPTIHKLQ